MSIRQDFGQPGVYNASPFSLSTGQGSALATDANGRVIMSGSGGFTAYEAKTFTIAGAQNNYDVKTSQSMFSSAASYIAVKTDIGATVKWNLNTNDGIILDAGEQHEVSGILAGISNVFITTTADTIVRIVAYR